jgi:hypothetical protein
VLGSLVLAHALVLAGTLLPPPAAAPPRLACQTTGGGGGGGSVAASGELVDVAPADATSSESSSRWAVLARGGVLVVLEPPVPSGDDPQLGVVHGGAAAAEAGVGYVLTLGVLLLSIRIWPLCVRCFPACFDGPALPAMRRCLGVPPG